MIQPVISASQLTKRYGEFVAVQSISFEIYPGEIFGFLGANGAGKTTAIKMLCGLTKATSGQASVAGHDVIKNPDAVKKSIGYMSQKFSLYEDLTVVENITFFGGIYGVASVALKEKTEELIEKLQLIEQRNTLVGSLPLGWKQKLAFSVALLHNPQVVFLDEPTGGVDPITRRQFWDLIYAAAHEGVCVFVTTHYMDEAEYCSRVSIMVDGMVQAIGTPRELKAQFNAENMDEVFYILARSAKRSGE